MNEPLPFAIEPLLRRLTPQVLGAVCRRTGDFAAAEDAVQEALLAAAVQWPHEGLPDDPRAWLIQVAARRMTDHVRAEVARRRREHEVVADAATEASAPDDGGTPVDDTLVLLFMCCHPALTRTSAIALTLRAVGGLTTTEIAAAYLVPEATMAQRISRAKQLIKKSGVPFALPAAPERGERLAAVLHVLYLVFSEGHTSSGGDRVQRVDLSDEAIRLARAVHAVVPDEPEVAGLLALMLLTDARRAARTGAEGELVPLDEQDRTRWNRAAIDEGTALLTSAMRRGAVGPYQLQAAIAALHDEATCFDDTDWPQIVALYDVLGALAANPMVTLNRAIALAMVNGPRAGLEALAPLEADPRMANHHLLAAARGHLLERAGNIPAAIEQHRLAAARTSSVPERNHLLLKAARLAAREEH